METTREIIIWIIGVAIIWVGARNGQVQVANAVPTRWPRYVIAVPTWLSFLCGYPLPNNQVELSRMCSQIGALLLGLVWIPLKIAMVGQNLRLLILLIGFLTLLSIPLIFTILSAFLKVK
jgi:hypothetical protein